MSNKPCQHFDVHCEGPDCLTCNISNAPNVIHALDADMYNRKMFSIHYCTGVRNCKGRCFDEKLVECQMCDLSSDYAPY